MGTKRTPRLRPSYLRQVSGGFCCTEEGVVFERGALWRTASVAGMSGGTRWFRLQAPDRAVWERLWTALEAARAEAWPPHVCDPMILDGTQWSLEVVWGPLCAHPSGSNAWPEGYGPVADVLRALRTSPPHPGVPAPFTCALEEGDREQTWDWDGRRLSWESQSEGGRGSRCHGAWVLRSPAAWRPFLTALRRARRRTPERVACLLWHSEDLFRSAGEQAEAVDRDLVRALEDLVGVLGGSTSGLLPGSPPHSSLRKA